MAAPSRTPAAPSHTQHVEWAEISSTLDKLTPLGAELGRLISARSGGKKLGPLFIATYSYGRNILAKGMFQTPCTAEDVANECNECRALRGAVKDSVPLSVVIENSVEIYRDSSTRTAPLRLLRAGELVGVFELKERLVTKRASSSPWSVSAGVRSVQVLAQVDGNNTYLAKATRILGKSVRGDRLPEFIRLAAEHAGYQWASKILIFPDAWISTLSPNHLPAAIERAHVEQFSDLLQQMIEDSDITRRCADALNASTMKKPELLPLYEIMRYLCQVARGNAPGYVPAFQEDAHAGPFAAFRAFIKGPMGADRYEPVVLVPRRLAKAGETALYSMKFPLMAHDVVPPKHSHIEGLGRFADVLSDMAAKDPSVTGWEFFSCEREQPNKLLRSEERKDQTGKALTPVAIEAKLKQRYPSIDHPGKLTDWFRLEDRTRLYANHPFFNACIKIVRS